MADAVDRRSAVFDAARVYRYRLDITWGSGRKVNFCMLNPSTADELANDPTVERCQRRARQMGYDGLVVTNLFAFRATKPEVLKTVPNPVGPANNRHLLRVAKSADLVICGWGVHGAYQDRGAQVLAMLRAAGITPMALAVTLCGQPGHPLYVAYSETPRDLDVRLQEAANA